MTRFILFASFATLILVLTVQNPTVNGAKLCTGSTFRTAGLLSSKILLFDTTDAVYELPRSTLNTNTNRLPLPTTKPIPFSTLFPTITAWHRHVQPSVNLSTLATLNIGDEHFVLVRFKNPKNTKTFQAKLHQIFSHSTKQIQATFENASFANSHWISSTEDGIVYQLEQIGTNRTTIITKYQLDKESSTSGYHFQLLTRFALCQGISPTVYLGTLPLTFSCPPVAMSFDRHHSAAGGITDGRRFYLFGSKVVYVFENLRLQKYITTSLSIIPNDDFFICGNGTKAGGSRNNNKPKKSGSSASSSSTTALFIVMLFSFLFVSL